MKIYPVLFSLLLIASPVIGQEPADETPVVDAETDDASEAADTDAPAEPAVAADGTRTMSGMSVLGNEEAPKSLVIIPWKSSEIGSDLGLTDTLDDRARPVDKEVFQRELDFYAIRAGDEGENTP